MGREVGRDTYDKPIPDCQGVFPPYKYVTVIR